MTSKKRTKEKPWYKNPTILLGLCMLVVALPSGAYYMVQLLTPHESEESFNPVVELWTATDIVILQPNQYQHRWDSKLCIFITYLTPHNSLVTLNKTNFIQDPNLQFKLLADAPEKPSVTVLSSSPQFLPRGQGNITLCFPLVVVLWLNPESSVREREIVLGELEFVMNVIDTSSKTRLDLNSTARVVWRNPS
jgi:hypothetical protein